MKTDVKTLVANAIIEWTPFQWAIRVGLARGVSMVSGLKAAALRRLLGEVLNSLQVNHVKRRLF